MRPSTHLLPLLPHALTISSLALHLPPTTPLTAPTLSTSTYNPQCINIINPPQPPLKPPSCTAAIRPACKKLTLITRPTPRDEWIWAEPFGQEGCALGWYLPLHATLPDAVECVAAFKAVIDKCASDAQGNAGNINVGDMPSLFGDGTAVVEGETRWVMAPQQLTR